jgi:hypothetical protein
MRMIQDFVSVAVQFEHLATDAPHPSLAKAYQGLARDCRAVALLRRRLITEGFDLHARSQQRERGLVGVQAADEP